MKHLFQIMRLLLTGEGRAFARGFALAATVLVIGTDDYWTRTAGQRKDAQAAPQQDKEEVAD